MRALEKLALAVTLVAVPHAHAQQPVTREQLNGEWTGTLVLDNSSPRIALVFRLTDSTFAGVAYADGDSLGEMQDGSLVGNRVHFKVDRFDFTGTVTGVSMKIDLIVFNGSTRTFVVRKSPRLGGQVGPGWARIKIALGMGNDPRIQRGRPRLSARFTRWQRVARPER